MARIADDDTKAVSFESVAEVREYLGRCARQMSGTANYGPACG